MARSLRIATFNLENLDDKSELRPSLFVRMGVLKPQLERLRADVFCFQEVNGQEFANEPRRLDALRQLLDNTRYEDYHLAYTITTKNEAFDVRNLVIASRFPIKSIEQLKHRFAAKPRYQKVTAVPPELEAKDVTWERPLLYVKLDLGNEEILHVINLHLKSKRPANINGQKQDRYTWKTMAGWAEGSFISSMKRMGQALEVRGLLDVIFDQTAVTGEPAYIAVCGDFNDDLESVTLRAICGPVEETNNPGLSNRVMIPCELSVPEPSRYSLIHRGKGEMLDHILVTRQLLTNYRHTEIHNEVLTDESGSSDVTYPESDHAPIVAEFVFP